MIYKLWYLADQSASGQYGIYDAKIFKGIFYDLASAQVQASSDGIDHYSVEANDNNGTDYSIIFIQ